MTNSSTSRRFSAEQRLLLAVHMAQDLPGDCQVLDDELLHQVLQGQRRLSRSEREAMLASPLTLCRLRLLESQRLGAQADGGRPAAVLPIGAQGWQRSEGLLLAAATDAPNYTLRSPDGMWALHSFTTGQHTRIRLQLRSQEDDGNAASLQLDPGLEVAVLDGRGGTLLLGSLDQDGELEAIWDRPLGLRSHLAQCGGGWTVERV